MSPVFVISYVLLAALLAWETIAVHGLIRRHAVLRRRRKRRWEEREARMLQAIPEFQTKMVGAEGCVTASILEGKSTALLFVDRNDESDKSMSDIGILLRRMHKDRHLSVFVGTRHYEEAEVTVKLRSILEQFPCRSVNLMHDQHFVMARKCQVDRFPTLLLAEPSGRIERIWTNVTLCSQQVGQTPVPMPATKPTLPSVPAVTET